MEFHHHGHGFFEEMLDSNIGFGINDIDDQIDQNALLATPTAVLESSPLSITSQASSSCFEDFSLPLTFDPQTLNCSPFGQHFINPFVDLQDLDHHCSPYNIKLESPRLFSMVDDVQNCQFVSSNRVSMEMPYPQEGDLEPNNMGKMNGKSTSTKVEGQQPSKNLMAERRRRKRLNDRLSMLRSVVPKISKMDRTSILADTIDYMKELIEKIKQMEMEMDISSFSNEFSLMTAKPKEIFIRNSPKFEVERRDAADTRVSVWCGGKPELLISTVTTLEALGLQIHQCVISCFNDFTMHASCSQDLEQRVFLTSDDIKQALYRNAGYGGKCL